MFGDHGLGGLPEEGAHEKSPKCLGWEFRGFFGGFAKVSLGKRMMSDAAILKILWWQTILDLVGIRSFVLTENSSSRISLSIVSDLNRDQKVIVFGETNSDKPL